MVTRRLVLGGGGVLWRDAGENPEVALVHRPAHDDWSLPKGKTKPGEHLLVTALREVTEETGHRPRIGPWLATVRINATSHGRSSDKVVTYWAMRCEGGSFVASREVDEMRWLPLEEAIQALDAESDRVVLGRFARACRDTEPLLLVRHGATLTPRRLRRRPEMQQLSRSGRDQAHSLVPVLAGLGVTDLLSADVPACIEMLAPFASATGLTVQRATQLTMSGFSGNEVAVADRVRNQASSSEALAVCGGQHVITGLLRALGRGSEVQPPSQTTVKKGGWWLLHHRDGAVSAYERHWTVA